MASTISHPPVMGSRHALRLGNQNILGHTTGLHVTAFPYRITMKVLSGKKRFAQTLFQRCFLPQKKMAPFLYPYLTHVLWDVIVPFSRTPGKKAGLSLPLTQAQGRGLSAHTTAQRGRRPTCFLLGISLWPRLRCFPVALYMTSHYLSGQKLATYISEKTSRKPRQMSLSLKPQPDTVHGEKKGRIWTKPNRRQSHWHPHQCPASYTPGARQCPAKGTPGLGRDLIRAETTENAADQQGGTEAEGKPDRHRPSLH